MPNEFAKIFTYEQVNVGVNYKPKIKGFVKYDNYCENKQISKLWILIV